MPIKTVYPHLREVKFLVGAPMYKEIIPADLFFTGEDHIFEVFQSYSNCDKWL